MRLLKVFVLCVTTGIILTLYLYQVFQKKERMVGEKESSLLCLSGFSSLFRARHGLEKMTLQNSTRNEYHDVVGRSSNTPECPHHIPSFEAAVTDQYAHILTKKPNFSRIKIPPQNIEKQFKSFKHRVQTGKVCAHRNMDYLPLAIREQKAPGEFSQGGSGFMVTVHHVYLVVCPVIDHFNGTYTSYCPLYNQRCANLSILIKHINFSGFNGRTLVLEKTIWEERVCVGEETAPRVQIPTINLADKAPAALPVTRFPVGLPVPQTQGHWARHAGEWIWVGHTGQLFPLQHNKTTCQCLQRFHRTYFIGASHIGIDSRCWNSLCADQDLKFFKRIHAKDVIQQLPGIMSEITTDTDASHNYQIIIQFGSHDLNNFPFQELIASGVPRFQAALQNLTSVHRPLLESGRLKLLVIAPPSLPDTQRIHGNIGPPVSYVVDRNNWISAVLALTLRKHMEPVPFVEFLDEFDFTFPLYWYVYSWPSFPNHHYCKLVDNHCYGHVGKAFLARIATTICPDIPMA